MANARPNVPDWEHQENLRRLRSLQTKGFRFEITSRGYRVDSPEVFLAAAGTLKKPHGRYREANIRDFTKTAVSIAQQAANRSDKELLQKVTEKAGACTRRGGHTDDDVNSDLATLSKWSGLHLVCLWDFDDCWGVGGNSDYAVVVPSKSGLYEAPREIFDHLWAENDEHPDPTSLLHLKPGPYIKGSNRYHEIDTHNWVRKKVEGEAD